ncbi:alkylphosphonate utilization operon protein PhnA, partial [Escherichia coli]|nr:alkylphosphonate utilization operon protein PhnA [Escherichia coli]
MRFLSNENDRRLKSAVPPTNSGILCIIAAF